MGAAALPIAAIALTAGSSLYGSFSQASQMNKNARVLDENARRSELQGALQSEDIRRDERMQAGEAIAAMGGNGIVLGTGSALSTLWQSAYNRELDIMNARYGAAQKAGAYRSEAKGLRSQAKATRIGGILRAGAAALSGASGMGGPLGAAGAGQVPTGSSFSMPVPSFGSLPTSDDYLSGRRY